MTVAAVKKTGPAPVKAAKPPPPAPVPAPSRRRGITPLTPMRVQAAKSMTKLADSMKESHPDMLAHQHVRDAARMLRSGNEEAAQRHLRAAMFAMTPQSLMRNGLHTDDHHVAARDAMHGIHRHLLLVKDVADVAAKNQAAIRRDSYDDDSSSPPPVTSPVRADPNAGYGPGALAQKPTARQPPGNQALNAPARSSSGGSDPAVADPVGTQPRGSKQFTTRNEAGAVTELAYGWSDLATLIGRDPVDLSAETGRLAATPAPYGKPGGPGLYGVAGMKHSDYFEQVVKALMARGKDKGTASKIAYGALRKWSAGGGHVHPEVRAAATGALAQEAAKGASAKAVHGHAVSWADVDRAINLAAAPAPAPAAAPASGQQGGALPARVAAGSATGGQFAAGSGGQPSQGKTTATGKAGAKPPLTAHQKHVAHVAHLLKVSTAKAGLLVTAQDDRAKASALIKQRDALVKALASAGGKTSTGQSGSTTSANSTTSSTAPAAAAPATAAAPASTSTASTTAAAPKAPAAAATAAPSASASATSAAGLKTQIAALNTQISGLLAQAGQATAQAAKMK